MNPWVILGFVVALVASGGVGYEVGFGHGVTAQKVADQREFDRINAERDQQKAEADELYRKAQADIIKTMAERDAFKRSLEVKDAENRKATAALAAKYSGVGLRFRTDQGSALGPYGGHTDRTEGNAPGAPGPTVVQLPDALAGNLRRLARDADELRDAYALCYGYANHE